MGDTAPKRLQLALEGGFTSGAGSVYQGGAPIVATRRLATEENIGADWEPVWSRPVEARGSYSGAYQSLLELMGVKGKLAAAVYADDMAWYGRMLYSGAPIVTTLPATPIALLAATAIAATMSLTTQPTAAGSDGAAARMLSVTLSNSVAQATAVSVTITGTSVTGAALSETLSFTAGTTTPSKVGGGAGASSVTLYTKNYFKTVNASGIACSSQPSGDLVAIGGINAFLWQFTPDMATSTLYSATLEYDDGTAAWQLPGTVLGKGTLDWQAGKSFKFDGTLESMKKSALAGSAGSINPSALAGDRNALQSLLDNNAPAISSALGNFYADPVGAAPGTTNVPARIIDLKFDVDNNVKVGKAGDGTIYPNYVGRAYYGDKIATSFTLLFNSYGAGSTDPAELAQFLAFASRTIRLAVPCQVALPCGVLTSTSGWPQALQVGGVGGYYGLMVDTAGKYKIATEKVVDGRMAFTFDQQNEVDLAQMGVGYQVWAVSRVNPNQV